MRHQDLNETNSSGLGQPLQASHCDFCAELLGEPDSSFHAIYGKSFTSRVVFEDKLSVLLPSLGQMTPGMWLVLPKRHVNRCSDLYSDEIASLLRLARKAESLSNDPSLFFEHGAIPGEGVNCGIYHAHLHVVPVHRSVRVSDLVPQGISHSSFEDALVHLELSPNYILARDTTGNISSRSIGPGSRNQFPSQYFRRRLAELLGTDTPWDWRLYRSPEPDVIALMNNGVNSDI